ncbi:MAG: ketoacyl-ACP synthase III [Spirochaetes bacterium]|nr:ketoacyl-ACP synthase III [Spirochaetota bacterium]
MNLKLPTFKGEISILDFGCWLPENTVESHDLQAIIDHFPEYRHFNIREKVGVIQRRISPHGVTVLDMAERAARDVIARAGAGFDIGDIDTILYCAVSRMYSEPSTAVLLQKRLGIPSAMSLDISNACLSFIDGLIVADSMIKSGRSRCALIVSAEKGGTVMRNSMRAMINREKGSECLASLTLGDGSMAVLVCSPSFRAEAPLRLRAFSRTTLSEYAECCILPSEDHPMSTDSRALFEGALTHFPSMVKNLLNDLQWSIDDVDVIVPHQASLKIIKKGMAAIGFPMEKCAVSIDRYGNMASVSIPFTLKQVLDERALKEGDRIVVLGFGSGLSFSMMALQVLNDGASIARAIA